MGWWLRGCVGAWSAVHSGLTCFHVGWSYFGPTGMAEERVDGWPCARNVPASCSWPHFRSAPCNRKQEYWFGSFGCRCLHSRCWNSARTHDVLHFGDATSAVYQHSMKAREKKNEDPRSNLLHSTMYMPQMLYYVISVASLTQRIVYAGYHGIR